MGSQSVSAYFRLIRDNRNFRRLWIPQIVSEVGDWFYIIAIYSLLLQITGKAQSVGLALVLQVLPSTLVGPTAGVLNDRIRRQHVMITADLVRMAIVLGMFLIRSAQTVWLVYPLLFIETVMWGFFEPARSAMIPNVVGEEQVLTANTLSSITWSFNFAMGSALGGLVAVWLGREYRVRIQCALVSGFRPADRVHASPRATRSERNSVSRARTREFLANS